MRVDRRVAADRRAFTLVEAVSTIVILGVLSVVSTRLIGEGARQYAQGASRAELSDEMGTAMERIVTELRQMQAMGGSDPVCPDFNSIASGAISWNDDNGERDLTFSAGQLTSTDNGTTTVLLSGVTSCVFRAYDENNVALAASLPTPDDCADVRRLEITLTVSREGVSETIRTRVFFRCCMAGFSS